MTNNNTLMNNLVDYRDSEYRVQTFGEAREVAGQLSANRHDFEVKARDLQFDGRYFRVTGRKKNLRGRDGGSQNGN